jgi:GGDEF domain-containing protein
MQPSKPHSASAGMAGETEYPRLSVTAGFAVFPANGKTIDELSTADAALYRMKFNNMHTTKATAKDT